MSEKNFIKPVRIREIRQCRVLCQFWSSGKVVGYLSGADAAIGYQNASHLKGNISLSESFNGITAEVEGFEPPEP